MRKLVGDLAPSPLINSSIAFLPAVIGFGFYTVTGVTEINLQACLMIMFIAMANVAFCRVWHRIDTYLFRLAILYGYVPFQWIYLFAITGFYFDPFNGQVLSLLIFALCSGMTVFAILFFKTRMDVSSGAFAMKGISVAALWGSAAFSDGSLQTFVNNDQVQVEDIKTQPAPSNTLLSESQFAPEKRIQKKSSMSRKVRFDKACGFSNARSPIDLDPQIQSGKSRIELSELKTNVLISKGVDTLFIGDIPNDKVKVDRVSRFIHSVEFRTPSEHAVNGYRFPMEIQVYLSEGSLNQLKAPSSAISIFVVEGSANSEFDKLTPVLKSLETESIRDALNLKLFFPNDLSHWVYSGTSTSLNCQTGQSLNWLVMKQPVSFSRDQIDLFRRTYSNNALSLIGPLTPSKIDSKSSEIAH